MMLLLLLVHHHHRFDIPFYSLGLPPGITWPRQTSWIKGHDDDSRTFWGKRHAVNTNTPGRLLSCQVHPDMTMMPFRD